MQLHGISTHFLPWIIPTLTENFFQQKWGQVPVE